MKEINEPNSYFKFDGELMVVIGIGDGKHIIFQPVGAKPCISCGRIRQFNMIEASPNFQNGAESIKTLSE